jgi:SAM-dependent methyltransferase
VSGHQHQHQAGHGHGDGDGDALGHGPSELTGEHWDAAYWDSRYAGAPTLWSGHVNTEMVAEAADLAPGRALDVACGEGGDALWLAARGWQVRGVDLSQVAVDRAAARAVEVGLADRTTWECRDLLDWTPPPASFDLVSVAFLHVPSAAQRRVYAGLAQAVATGGTFLVVAHGPEDLETGSGRSREPDLFSTVEDLVAILDGAEWEILTSETRRRTHVAHDGHDGHATPDGGPGEVQDTVLTARRRPRPTG